MLVLQKASEIESYSKSQSEKTIGFVPTMGALHEGHAELLKKSVQECDLTVLSIYVNPTQFSEGEDLEQYPRTLEKDLKIAKSLGVDCVFTPTTEQMYPEGDSTFILETKNSQGLCGEFRPGHFQGVTTIVYKLFKMVKPRKAYFGLKDIQQFFVIQKMIHDLALEIELKGVPTIREDDGLALSSRNRYLSESERKKAPLLYQHLREAQKKIQSGTNETLVCNEMNRSLGEYGFEVQYFQTRTFLPNETKVLAVAAYLGKTRLIDNLILDY